LEGLKEEEFFLFVSFFLSLSFVSFFCCVVMTWRQFIGSYLERIGARLSSSSALSSQPVSSHLRIGLLDKPLSELRHVFIAPTASLIGKVTIGEDSSIWYGTILRADQNSIKVGANSSIGDNSVIQSILNDTTIGKNVTIEHGSIIEGVTIEDNVKIEAGAVLLDGVHVETNTIIASGSVLPPGQRIPSGQLWAGNPAQYVRDLTDEDKEDLPLLADDWCEVSQRHHSVVNMSEIKQTV